MTPTDNFFIHPLALCESQRVGAGTRIWAFAHVMAGARLGRGCNVGDHAFIESGAVIGDGVTIKNNVLIWEGVTIAADVFIGPGVIFTNDQHPRSPRMAGVDAVRARYADKKNWLLKTKVGRGASLGAGCIILPGLNIGNYALVGAGAVVRREVPAHAIVVGNPGTLVGWACHCGQKLAAVGGKNFKCAHCRQTFSLNGQRLTSKTTRV
jgi:acetyltransferase-like isoleucine patch superfamily enzyme